MDIGVAFTVIVLFVLPVLYFAWKRKAFLPFSLKQLTLSFDLAFIVHFLFAVIFSIILFLLDHYADPVWYFNPLVSAINLIGLIYLVYGLYVYFPGLIALNIVSFAYSYFTEKKLDEVGTKEDKASR